MNGEDEKLDRLLRQWHCPVVKNPGLGGEVWQRIAEREESAWSDGGIWSLWIRRPLMGSALAATLVLGAILAGIGAAEIRMKRADHLVSVQSQEQAYFESINPVALARHGHP